MNFLFPILFKRTGFALLTLFAISILIFAGLEALPGDTAQAILGQGATEENLSALRKELKLDLPIHQNPELDRLDCQGLGIVHAVNDRVGRAAHGL